MATTQQNTAYTAEDFKRYHAGTMTDQEMNSLERAALEDPFLADALDGYSKSSNAENDLKELEKHFKAVQTRKKPVLHFNLKSFWLRAAAVLILFAGMIYLFTYLNSDNERFYTSKKSENPKAAKEQQADSVTPVQNELNATAPLSIDRKEMPVLKTQASQKFKKENQAAPIQSNKDHDFANAESALEKNENADNTSADALLRKENVAPAMTDQTSAKTYSVSGTIVDSNGSKIPFASINAPANGIAATSDANGKYFIITKDSILPATIAAAGYSPVQTNLGNRADQQIILLPKAETFNDVAEISNETKLKKAGSAAMKKAAANDLMKPTKNSEEPTIESANFQNYVKNNIRKPKSADGTAFHGKVGLSFEIDKDGNPVNIKIETPLAQACDDEATRLLREGPKWKKKDNRRQFIYIDF